MLKPGEILDEHKNPFDVIFFVAEGKGSLSVERTKYQQQTNDLVKITSDKMRGWENTSDKELRLLVLKLL